MNIFEKGTLYYEKGKRVFAGTLACDTSGYELMTGFDIDGLTYKAISIDYGTNSIILKKGMEIKMVILEKRIKTVEVIEWV